MIYGTSFSNTVVHRCVTHLYGIPLISFYLSGETIFMSPAAVLLSLSLASHISGFCNSTEHFYKHN